MLPAIVSLVLGQHCVVRAPLTSAPLGERSFFWFSLIQEEGRCLECCWIAPHGKPTCGKWGHNCSELNWDFPWDICHLIIYCSNWV